MRLHKEFKLRVVEPERCKSWNLRNWQRQRLVVRHRR